jgi:hypothetical protein
MEESPTEVSVSIPTLPTPKREAFLRSNATHRSLGRKDESYILKRMKQFAPLYIIAQELGVCRQTLYSYLRDKMNLSYKDMRESMIDVAEGKLFKNIIDGNQSAIEYFLDRQAKHRGYGVKEVRDREDVPVINIGKIEIAPPTDAQPQPVTVEAETVAEVSIEERKDDTEDAEK